LDGPRWVAMTPLAESRVALALEEGGELDVQLAWPRDSLDARPWATPTGGVRFVLERLNEAVGDATGARRARPAPMPLVSFADGHLYGSSIPPGRYQLQLAPGSPAGWYTERVVVEIRAGRITEGVVVRVYRPSVTTPHEPPPGA